MTNNKCVNGEEIIVFTRETSTPIIRDIESKG